MRSRSVRSLSSLIALSSAALLTLAAADAQAKVDKALQEELSPVVVAATKSDDLEARQVALLTWGLWADKKQLKEVEAFKTQDDPAVRLGAGLALYLSGQRKSEKFVVEELGKDNQLYLTLRDRVSLLPDKKEAKLLTTLAGKGASPEVLRDTTRYLSGQRGELFTLLTGWATNKKASARRDAALEALVASGREDALGVVPLLLANKDSKAQLAGVALAKRINATHPSSSAQVAKALEGALTTKDEAVRLAVVKALLSLNAQAATGSALVIAASTEDASLRREMMQRVLDGVDRGLKPSIKNVKPLLEKELKGDELVLAYKVAAATGDAGVRDTLLKFYTSNTFEERLLAAQALPYTSDSGVVGLLERSLFEGDRRMRLYSAQGLARVGQEKSLTPLQKALSGEKDREIKLAVVDALGAIPNPAALRVLRFQVTSSDVELKRRVIKAVRRQGSAEGLKVLEQLLKDRDASLRWDAFIATMAIDAKRGEALIASSLRELPASFSSDVASLPLPAQKKILEAAARSSLSSVRPLGLGVMKSRRSEFQEILRELVTDASYNKGSRRSILDLLITNPSAKDLVVIERLASTEKDLDIRKQAAWALTSYADESMQATFRGMLGHPDMELRALAACGLATTRS